MKITTEDLNRRVTLKLWSEVSDGTFGLTEQYSQATRRLAKVEPIYGLTMRQGMQTGEVPTHLFWVRYGPGTQPTDITVNHIFEWNGRRYRVLDAINVDDAQRFTRVSVKDLGNIT